MDIIQCIYYDVKNMHRIQYIEYNAKNTMQRIQYITIIQCIEYNAYNTMHRIQCIEYNA